MTSHSFLIPIHSNITSVVNSIGCFVIAKNMYEKYLSIYSKTSLLQTLVPVKTRIS